MTTSLIVLAAILGCGLILAVATALDRFARETAWRRIAEERRWNYDRRTGAR